MRDMKIPFCLLAACAAGLLSAAPQTFESGAWRLSYDGRSHISLARNGRTLLSNVTFGYWTEHYQGMRLASGGFTVSRAGDTVTFARTNDHAGVRLDIALAKDRADLALDVDIRKAPGPFEYGFYLPVDSFRVNGGMPFCRLGKDFLAIEDQPLATRGGGPLRFELPDASCVLRNEGAGAFMLQDRRRVKKEGDLRYIVCRAVDAPGRHVFRHSWTVQDGFSAAQVAERAAIYSKPLVRAVAVDVPNADFENGKTEWSLPENAALDGTVARSGACSARLTVKDPMKEAVYVTRRVPVTGGALYRASCFVKTEDVKSAPGRMESVGAGLIVEWSDRSGKWMAAGDYACKNFGTKDWFKAECPLLKAPEDAGYAQIYLALRGAGTAWFDDFAFTAVTRVVDMESPAPGATFANNTPRFTWADLPGVKGYTVEFARDAAFTRDRRAYTVVSETSFQLEEPLEPGTWYWRATAPGATDGAAWSFVQTAPKDRDCLPPVLLSNAQRVIDGAQSFTVQVRENGPAPVVTYLGVTGTCARAAADGVRDYVFAPPPGGWPRGFTEQDMVAVDAAGNRSARTFWLLNAPKPANGVVVDGDGWFARTSDGARVFPLGIYEVEPKYLAEVRAAGIDAVHLYRWESSQDDVACRAYLDTCWKTDGLRAFIGFDRGNASGKGIVQGNFAHVARRVGALADHPGLFCWYLFDEPEILGQYVSPERLTAFADLVRALDPYHAVVMTTWNQTMINYRRTWDTHWTQAYGDPAGVVRQVEEHRRFLRNESPITLLVNCNDGAQTAARRQGVKPDPEKFSRDYDHLRACAFLSIVQNCNGLWWWWFARENGEYVSASQCPKAWADLVKVMKEVVALRPLVNAPAPTQTGTAVDGQAKVEWWRKTVDGKTTLIAVNTGTVPATVDLPGLGRQAFRRHEVKILDVPTR